MAKEDRSGRLGAFLNPDLSDLERSRAAVEGSIWGPYKARGGIQASDDRGEG